MLTDFHTHILPDIDDGSSSLKESLWLCEQEQRQGISHVVATPHFYPQSDAPGRFFAKREEAEVALMEALRRQSSAPLLSVGAEVYFFRGISDSEILPRLTIDGKNGILVEMPMAKWTDAMYVELEAIRSKQGLLPIVAHVDRYIQPFATHGIPEQLAELPVLVQANASFFIRRSTRRLALKLLRQDKIHLIGSDCHNSHTRTPNLQEAIQIIEKHLGREALEQIRQYEEMVLS